MNRIRRRSKGKGIIDPQSCSNCKYIPVDPTAEILSRLPIKSIGRFMLVSTSWRDIITSRRFSSMHAKNTPFSTLYDTLVTYYSLYKHGVVEVFENGDCVRTTLKRRVGSHVVGSCNGLLCLVDYLAKGEFIDKISILNPLTNESAMITFSNYDDNRLRKAEVYYSFGYCPSTNEYKVFRCITMLHAGRIFSDEFEILTVGVDEKWRKLSPHLFHNHMRHICDGMVYYNGAFRWLVLEGWRSADNFIVAFDIAEENTRRVPIRPSTINQIDLRLLVLDNCLCLSGSIIVSDEVNTIWKMEDYYGDSWSQIVMPNRIYVRRCDDDYDRDIILPLNSATKLGCMLFTDIRFADLGLYCLKSRKYTVIRYPYTNDHHCMNLLRASLRSMIL